MTATKMDDPKPSTYKGKPLRATPRVALSELTPNNVGTARAINAALLPVAYSDRFYKDALDARLERYSRLVYYNDVPVGAVLCRMQSTSAPLPSTLQDASQSAPAPAHPQGKGSKKATEPEQTAQRLYIATLGVLAPYRSQGLGRKLVEHVLGQAKRSQDPASLASEQQYRVKPSAHSSAANEPTPAAPKTNAAAKAAKLKEEQQAKKQLEDAVPRIESVWVHVQVGNDEAKRFWESLGFEVTDTAKDYYRKIEPRDAFVMEHKLP